MKRVNIRRKGNVRVYVMAKDMDSAMSKVRTKFHDWIHVSNPF